MTARDLPWSSIRELSGLIKARRVSASEVVQTVLDRIEAVSPKLNDYITVTAEQARAAAKRADAEIAAGRYRGPLHGIPVGLKDLYATKGVRTTSGSKILADHVPDHDSTVAERLVAAGAIIVGKHNCHEFAMGSTTTNPHYGPARNPWDLERIPGGSSGGTGASVTAGTCMAGMGTDTGGSIRNPSSLCGNVGLKPTYGRVSRFGVTPLSWSLDHAGPHTRTVWDAAAMLNAIAGHDPRDPSSGTAPVLDYTSALGDGASLSGLRVGVPKSYFWEGASQEVLDGARAAIGVLERLGATVVDVDLPSIHLAAAASSTISWGESSAYHHDWIMERPQDYGEDVRERLEAGSRLTAVQYMQAQRIRRMVRDEALATLRQVDVMACPGAPVTAPRIGEAEVAVGGQKVRVLRLMSRFTRPWNVTGSPAIAVPCGFSDAGLPLSFQIVGRDFDEATVLRVAHAYEQATDWHKRRPRL